MIFGFREHFICRNADIIPDTIHILVVFVKCYVRFSSIPGP